MADKTSIGIVGTGLVGTSVAISTLHAGAAQELLLNDADTEVADGEAMDLSQGSSFYPSAIVRSVSLPELTATDAVVIAAGRGGGSGETRLELLKDNAAIIAEIAGDFEGYEGIVVVVTNPVDILTQVFQREAGLAPARVIGTGTMLDTTRLRQILGRELGVDPRSAHAQVIGEHGDSEVCLWSSAVVGGMSLAEWPGWSRQREEAAETEVRESAYRIIEKKGSTNHAIGLVTANLLRGMLRNERRVLTVSRVQEGACGIEDLALSLPTIVGADGATEVLEPDLNTAERSGLERSAEVLREALGSVT